MRTTTTTVAVLLLCASSACSSNDRADTIITTLPTPETTASTPAPSTTPPTTAPPTSPPTVPVTPPATTQPTAPPTSPPTTAPLDPIADLTAAIQRDAQAGEEAALRAYERPSELGNRDLLAAYFTGPALESALSGLAWLVDQNMITLPNPDIRSIVRITSEPSLVPDADPPRAVAETCRINAGVVWATIDNSDVRAIFNDDVERSLARTTFVLIDGVWHVDGGELLDSTIGAATCE